MNTPTKEDEKISLHDIDKTDRRRLNPAPNTNDKIADRLAHGTTQFHNAVEEEAEANGLKIGERQIIARQGGVNKAVFGFFGEANKFGLRVAKEGSDVLSASAANLIFNSEQNVFKIVASGVGSVDAYTPIANTFGTGAWWTGASATVIPHNLGFTPAVLIYVDTTGGPADATTGNFVLTPASILDNNQALTGFSWTHFYSGATATNVFVNSITQTFNPTSIALTPVPRYYFKYFLLQESAAAN